MKDGLRHNGRDLIGVNPTNIAELWNNKSKSKVAFHPEGTFAIEYCNRNVNVLSFEFLAESKNLKMASTCYIEALP